MEETNEQRSCLRYCEVTSADHSDFEFYVAALREIPAARTAYTAADRHAERTAEEVGDGLNV